MQVIHVADQTQGAQDLAEHILTTLQEKKVLWLVCGGSNIPLSVTVMNEILSRASKKELSNLTVGLIDERYGEVGHPDSNWQQLFDAGFTTDSISTVPILTGKKLDETVTEYSNILEKEFAHSFVIAQCGIGQDGHIAGILPHSVAITDAVLVCSYESPPFTRVTITTHLFSKISIAYAFAFGESKRKVVRELTQEEIPLSDMPSQILKQLPLAYLYSDQI